MLSAYIMENTRQLIEKYYKDTILYLEEGGFYEDVEYSKALLSAVFSRPFNILDKPALVRVSINKNIGFSLSISATFASSRTVRRYLNVIESKKGRLQIIKTNMKFLKTFVDDFIASINHRNMLDSIFELNPKLHILAIDDEGYHSNNYAAYAYICVNGSREVKKSTVGYFDLMNSEFPREVYNYCKKHSLEISKKLKDLFE